MLNDAISNSYIPCISLCFPSFLMTDYALGKGLPIFVSECAGMEASGDGPISKEEWGNWLDWMQRHSISWVAWSLSDKDETCSMFYPSASSEGNWKDADMKEWGRMVRDELKK